MTFRKALMRCDAISISAPADDDKKADAAMGKMRAGRWRLNAGSRMMMCIGGVNEDADGNSQPINVILDMDTLEVPDRAPALADHDDSKVIGVWNNLSVEGGELSGDLTLAMPIDDREAAALQDAVRASALIRAGVPWQASVGVEATYELVTPDAPVTANGQLVAVDAADEFPVYVARKGSLFEASVVLRGADSNTGQIAAKASKTKGIIMSDKLSLKELLAKHSAHKALVAELFADDKSATDIATAVHDAELKTARDEGASLRKELEDLKASRISKADMTASGKAPAAGHRSSEESDGTSWLEARASVMAENPKLKGQALNAAVARKFPGARPEDVSFRNPNGSRN